MLNSPPIIITVGNRGGGLVAYQAGGRYTSSPRCLNFEPESLMFTDMTVPVAGRVPARCIAVTVAWSVSSGSGPAVNWFHAVWTVGK